MAAHVVPLRAALSSHCPRRQPGGRPSCGFRPGHRARAAGVAGGRRGQLRQLRRRGHAGALVGGDPPGRVAAGPAPVVAGHAPAGSGRLPGRREPHRAGGSRAERQGPAVRQRARRPAAVDRARGRAADGRRRAWPGRRAPGAHAVPDRLLHPLATAAASSGSCTASVRCGWRSVVTTTSTTGRRETPCCPHTQAASCSAGSCRSWCAGAATWRPGREAAAALVGGPPGYLAVRGELGSVLGESLRLFVSADTNVAGHRRYGLRAQVGSAWLF